MLPTTQIGHRYKSVIVNKPALQAWLLAWATGESLPVPISPGGSSRKAEQFAVATVQRLQQTIEKQSER